MADIPEKFKAYLSSLLKNIPITPPLAALDQWKELLSILRAHWVIPFLYARIAKLPAEFRPPHEIVENMQGIFVQSSLRALQTDVQLQELVQTFDNGGIDMIVLKGGALGRTIYPDPALRPGSDLDILVRPNQFERACSIMGSLGYRTRYHLSVSDIYRDLNHEKAFIHKTKGSYLGVGLHWDLYNFHSIVRREARIEDFFTRSIKAKTEMMTFNALHPVDALIHAAIHLIGGHRMNLRLIWIHDIALLAKNLTIPDDWANLQKRCVRWSARLAVEEALNLAREWTGINLPSGFEDFSRWPLPADSERLIYSNNKFKKVFYLLKSYTEASPLEKVHLCLEIVFPRPEVIRSSYPMATGLKLPLAYIKRWGKWVIQLWLLLKGRNA
jgi:hypothetical protein